MDLHENVPELGKTLAEELLEPTRIYVKPVMEMINAGLPLHALLHITGDGFCNMNRIQAEVGFEFDALPEPGPIYKLIQERGGISDAEMYSVFNMGIGFCVTCDPADADRALEVLREVGTTASVIGRATAEHVNEVRLMLT